MTGHNIKAEVTQTKVYQTNLLEFADFGYHDAVRLINKKAWIITKVLFCIRL